MSTVVDLFVEQLYVACYYVLGVERPFTIVDLVSGCTVMTTPTPVRVIAPVDVVVVHSPALDLARLQKYAVARRRRALRRRRRVQLAVCQYRVDAHECRLAARRGQPYIQFQSQRCFNQARRRRVVKKE